MTAICHWYCAEPGCGHRNMAYLDTAKPRLVLVCKYCGKPAHVQVSFENHVEEGQP